MTVYTVRHVTRYAYRRPVRIGPHEIIFRPRDSYDQNLLSAELTVSPSADLTWRHDLFGNCIARADFGKARADELLIESVIRVDHRQHGHDVNGRWLPGGSLGMLPDEACQTFPFAYDTETGFDLARFARVHHPSLALSAFVAPYVTARRARGYRGPRHGRRATIDIHGLFAAMAQDIHQGFSYATRHAYGTQTPEETLRLRKGTCRDFALLMMEAARSLGLAARFVSGYLYVPGADTPEHRATSNEPAASLLGGGSTHAWCEIYVPGLGWAEFDPTNGLVDNRELIRVAVARDPGQISPISGSWTGKSQDFLGLTVQVDVFADAACAASSLSLVA